MSQAVRPCLLFVLGSAFELHVRFDCGGWRGALPGTRKLKTRGGTTTQSWSAMDEGRPQVGAIGVLGSQFVGDLVQRLGGGARAGALLK